MGKSRRVSEQCKTYELYARRNRAKEPFPIELREMLLYIRYRGRSSVFCNHLANLEVHPLHGPSWFEAMSNEPEVQNMMRYFVKKWKPSLASHKVPVVGIDYNADPSFYDATESDMEEFERTKPKPTPKKTETTTTTTTKKTVTKKTATTKQTKKIAVAPSVPMAVPKPLYTNVFSVAGPHRKVGFISRSKPAAEQLATTAVIPEVSSAQPTPTTSNTTSTPNSPSSSDSSLAQVVPDHTSPPPHKKSLPPPPPPTTTTTTTIHETIYHDHSESPEESLELEDDMSPEFIEPYILIERYDHELSDVEEEDVLPPTITNKRKRKDEKTTKSKKSSTTTEKDTVEPATTTTTKKEGKKTKSTSPPKRKNNKTAAEATPQKAVTPSLPESSTSFSRKMSPVFTEASYDYDDGYNFDEEMYLTLESSVMEDKGKGKGKEKALDCVKPNYDDEPDYDAPDYDYDDTVFDYSFDDTIPSTTKYKAKRAEEDEAIILSDEAKNTEEDEVILLSDDEENSYSHLIIHESPLPTTDTTTITDNKKDAVTPRRKAGRPKKNSESQFSDIEEYKEEKVKTKESWKKRRDYYKKKLAVKARKPGSRRMLKTKETSFEVLPIVSYNEIVDNFINNPDSEFTEEVYDAYLEKLEQEGIEIDEPELMVLSHVAIERY